MGKKALHLVPGPEISTLTSSGCRAVCVCRGWGWGLGGGWQPPCLQLANGSPVTEPGVPSLPAWGLPDLAQKNTGHSGKFQFQVDGNAFVVFKYPANFAWNMPGLEMACLSVRAGDGERRP